MFVSQSDYHKYFTKPSRGRKSDVPWDDIGEHNNDWYWFVKDSDRTKNQIDGDQRPTIPKRLKAMGKKFRTERIHDDRINEWGIMILRTE